MIQSCFRRYEKKYLLTKEQYQAMLLGMAPYMKQDRYPHYSISNIYYDTDNYDLIRDSLEKPVYKEKLRLRSYGVPGKHDTVFIEIKKKFEGVVYKRRRTQRAICGAFERETAVRSAARSIISCRCTGRSQRCLSPMTARPMRQPM